MSNIISGRYDYTKKFEKELTNGDQTVYYSV